MKTIIPIKQIIIENDFQFVNKFQKFKDVPNYRNAVIGSIVAPVAGMVVGGATGNFIHGDGDMNSLESGKLMVTNPNEYNQRINDDEYDGTGALIGMSLGGALSPNVFNQVRKNRSFLDKADEKIYDYNESMKRNQG